MARKFLILVLLMSGGLSGITAVRADGLGKSWKNHAAPYDFMFNNLIDTHQQMKLRSDGTLHGWIYIQVVNEISPDAPDGVPIARRADCTNPALDCRVGWEVIGVPVSGAKLFQKGPRLWDMSQVTMLSDTEFLHFHWMGTPKKPCGLTIGAEYNGYLFKRTAVTTFFWLGGNPNREDGRLVTPGVDLHSNIYGIWSGGGEGEDHEEDSCGGHDSGSDTGEGGHDSGGDIGGGGHAAGS